jgi:hypothetical protein
MPARHSVAYKYIFCILKVHQRKRLERVGGEGAPGQVVISAYIGWEGREADTGCRLVKGEVRHP